MEVLVRGSSDLTGKREIETKEAEAEAQIGYFCLICYSTVEEDEAGYMLPCKHTYCRCCIQAYVESNVMAGQTNIKCFHVDNVDPSDIAKLGTPCNAIMPEENIMDILKASPDYSAKYSRFKYLKCNANARECPHCSHLAIGDPQHPIITCSACEMKYCFSHALAHPVDITCSDYEKATASHDQVNIDLIASTSKPCPGCGMNVSKSDGCNHMKCPNCNASFCWLCGIAIEDAVFPTHFQWWNVGGCANMQMVEAVTPSLSTVAFARTTACLQTIIIGPLAVVSSIASSVACFMCIPCFLTGRKDLTPLKFFEGCVSGWGFFWVFLLVFVPVLIVSGTLALFVALLISPCYVYNRAKHGQLPFRILNDLFAPPRDSAPATMTTITGDMSEKDIESSGERGTPVCCRRGHTLSVVGSSMVRTWICDATAEVGGCLCGSAAYSNVRTETRYRCNECDFDYCGKCYRSRMHQSLNGQENVSPAEVAGVDCRTLSFETGDDVFEVLNDGNVEDNLQAQGRAHIGSVKYTPLAVTDQLKSSHTEDIPTSDLQSDFV